MDQKIYNYMVCIHCMTFNHAPYIEDCMNGFVMQQTSFPFVALIVDDASTDNNADVILKFINSNFYIDKKDGCFKETASYGSTVFAKHNTNENCFFVFVQLKTNHYSIRKDKEVYLRRWLDKSKYCAMCEGDDYWTDPNKLEKQIAIMESDDSIGLTYTDTDIYYQTQMRNGKTGITEYRGFRSLLYANPVPTLTSLFRLDLYYEYLNDIKPLTRDWKLGDYPLWIWLAAHSKVVYLDEITATYRVLNNSASHSTDAEEQAAMYESDYDVQIFFLEKYLPDDKELRVKIEDKKNRRIAEVYDAHGLRKQYLSSLRMINEKSKKERLFLMLFSIGPLYALEKKILSHNKIK